MSDFEQDIRQVSRRSDASWNGPINIGDPKGALTSSDETEAPRDATDLTPEHRFQGRRV
jgi:hypothetical protein